MSAILDRAPCDCASIGKPAELWQCPHFHIFRGDRRLTSVSRIVGASFPLPPGIPPDVLESARERGSEVDALFAAYVLGKLDRIPAGTRNDSRDLFLKAKAWYDRQSFKTVEVQVLLGTDDYGGVLDFRCDGVPLDLKCTHRVEHSARMQVAAYGALCMRESFILHVTERLKEAHIVALTQEDASDWDIILEHWRMQVRRQK